MHENVLCYILHKSCFFIYFYINSFWKFLRSLYRDARTTNISYSHSTHARVVLALSRNPGNFEGRDLPRRGGEIPPFDWIETSSRFFFFFKIDRERRPLRSARSLARSTRKGKLNLSLRSRSAVAHT